MKPQPDADQRDLDDRAGLEEKKQAFNCDDVACLAEIGGALGVDRILSSRLGKVGDTYVVNIKRINIAEASTEDRVYETITGKQDEFVLNGLGVKPKKLAETYRKLARSVSSKNRRISFDLAA